MSSERSHIYIEGMDLCGKDTVAGIVARDLAITNIQKLALVDPNPFNVDKNKFVLPDDLLFGAYLARSIIYDLENWSPLKVRQLQVSFTGVRSASYRAGFPDGLGPVFQELLKYSPLFDHAFLLTASTEARKERIAARGSAASVHDRLIFTEPDRVARMDASILDNASKMMGATIIDTTNLTPDQVADEVKRMIAGSQPKDVITGVRLEVENIQRGKKYLEKEIQQYWDFVIRKKGLNI